jgi:predicted transcriptional regulator
MKSATLPPLRVTPALRAAAESVLREGESLSSFVEDSVRQQIERRRVQQEFIARGLAAGAEAQASGQYASKEEVMATLSGILAQAEGARAENQRKP